MRSEQTYIFLDVGDEIMAGDEFWSRVQRKWLTVAFPGGTLSQLMAEVPYRRRVNAFQAGDIDLD